MSDARIVEDDVRLAEIVRALRRVVVVGMKDESQADVPAHAIPKALQARGIAIVPVNPKLKSALGSPAYARIADVPGDYDMVNVFRKSAAVGPLADEILALPLAQRPRVVWMQSGVRNEEAAQRLAAAGIDVVMDRCLGVYVAMYLHK